VTQVSTTPWVRTPAEALSFERSRVQGPWNSYACISSGFCINSGIPNDRFDCIYIRQGRKMGGHKMAESTHGQGDGIQCSHKGDGEEREGGSENLKALRHCLHPN
jgi:hypothetical protein